MVIQGQKKQKPGVQPYHNNAAANTAEMPSLSREHMEQLLKLLKSNPSTTAPVGSLAQIGSFFSVTSIFSSMPWIIDSSASEHYKSGLKMGVSHLLQGKEFLSLKKLHFMLSIRKLSKDSNCCVTFFYSHCKFQNRSMGKMIGSARMQDGLYYFDEKGFQNKQVQTFVGNVSSFSVYEKIMLWHHRLDILVFLIETFISWFV